MKAMHQRSRIDLAGRIFLLAGILAIGIGALSAANPLYGIVVGLATAGFLGLALLHRSPITHGNFRQANPYVMTSAALVFLSLVQFWTRNATSSSLGFAAIYEFALQASAVGVCMIGLLQNRIKFHFSVPAGLWTLVGLFALTSAMWATIPLISALKGVQLMALGIIVPVLASNFANHEQAAKFLGRSGAGILAVIMIIQTLLGGIGSLWQAYEIGNPEYVGGRYRLSLVQIYPLTLGILTGALILLLLVNNPRAIDWLSITFLSVVQILTFSRGPLAILIATILLYAALRWRKAHLSITWGIIGCLGLLWILTMLALVIPATSQWLTSPQQSYFWSTLTSLNGRLPLWQQTIGRIFNAAPTFSSILVGQGFASFRFFGLGIFDYAGEAHDAFIQVLYELGIVGLCLWMLAIGSCIIHIWNRRGGLLQSLIRILPLMYLLLVETMDSSLADSRSFVLMILLLYTCTPKDLAEESTPGHVQSEPSAASARG